MTKLSSMMASRWMTPFRHIWRADRANLTPRATWPIQIPQQASLPLTRLLCPKNLSLTNHSILSLPFYWRCSSLSASFSCSCSTNLLGRNSKKYSVSPGAARIWRALNRTNSPTSSNMMPTNYKVRLPTEELQIPSTSESTSNPE